VVIAREIAIIERKAAKFGLLNINYIIQNESPGKVRKVLMFFQPAL
jgi:hypothetical protein